VDHEVALLVGELQPCDLLGAGDGLARDLRAGRGLRPEDAGEERGAEAEGAEVRHEGAAVELRAGGGVRVHGGSWSEAGRDCLMFGRPAEFRQGRAGPGGRRRSVRRGGAGLDWRKARPRDAMNQARTDTPLALVTLRAYRPA